MREPLSFPLGELLGIRMLSADAGQAVAEMDVDERHSNPMGTLHGGILCDLADTVMGIAFATTLDEGDAFTTLELKINFLRPFWKGRLKAVGRVVHRGKTVGMVESEVADEQGRVVAKSTSTVLLLRGEMAEGRKFPGK